MCLAEVLKDNEGRVMMTIASIRELTKGPTLAKVSGAVVLGAAGVSVTYYVAKLGFNYLDAKLAKPTLIRETSIKSPKEIILDFLLGRKPAKSRFNEIILDADLDFKLKEIAQTTEMGIQDGDGVRHVLLTGPAGTGKTMFAKALAMRLNQMNLQKNGKRIPVNYICLAGADFAQFKPGEDIEAIHSIVDYAMNAEGITIVFIDEIDSLLRNRLDAKATEASINRTNTMLTIFDKPTHSKIMLIGGTNFESQLDRAAYTRFSKKVAFKLPSGDTLTKLFDQYIKKEVVAKKIAVAQSFIDRKQELIDSLNGLSPRMIEDVAGQMYSRVRFVRQKELTYEIAKSIIDEARDADARNKAAAVAA